MEKSFRDLEHAGWQAKAEAYDSLFAQITNQAISPVLESFGSLNQQQLLDVACGTGNLAGAAAEMGATSEGLDFASSMIEISRTNFPGLLFTEGDAENLPKKDASFDAVVCSFGLLHLEQPEQAVSEAWRVLKSGGRYTYTIWSRPDQGGEFFELIMGAVQTHGTMDVPLPPAPPVFRFADPEESRKIMTGAGFVEIKHRNIPLQWRASEPGDVLELIYKSIVRMPMLLEAQSDKAKEAIHQAIIDGCENFQQGRSIKFEFPVLMVSGTKP